LVGGVLLWLAAGSGSPVPKGWKTLNQEKQSPAYDGFVNPPLTGAASQCPDRSAHPPYHDWNKPHVAVYSAAATRHPLPTLRDLSDRGQAEAIEFLEKAQTREGQSWTKLRDALSDTEAPALGEKDPFRFDRLLVGTVAEGASWDPGIG
jgi:hypothetical protein